MSLGELTPGQRAVLDHLLSSGLEDSFYLPAMNLAFLHNLTVYLADAGHLAHAAFLIRRCRHLYDQAGSDLIRLRGRYLQGRLAAYEERWGEAITCLERARREFLERGLPYDAAPAGLDLALVWVRLRRHREVFRLAPEMYPVFVAKEIPREAPAAFLLFVEARRRRWRGLPLPHRGEGAALRPPPRAAPGARPSPAPSDAAGR